MNPNTISRKSAWNGKNFQTITKASIVKGREDIVEEMDASEEACIIEKNDLRQVNQIKDEIVQIADETRNCAVLDTGCTSSVVGKTWLKAYMQESGKGLIRSKKVF